MSVDHILEVEDIECRFDTESVVRGLSMRIRSGAVVCLLGPSGCGKTTVLRAIAGFHPVHRGLVRLRGQVVSEPGYGVAPEQRHVGMVFQDYALFPHLSILQNTVFGVASLSRRDRRKLGIELLELVGLEGLANRYPHELSGGQQQRVAVARALATKPDLILLDEPFSNLDVELRERLSDQVHAILKSQGISGIMVTHDQHEAFAMGEQVGVMHKGRILQWDSPFNLYHDPAERFIADFIGQGCFVSATLKTPDTLETDLGLIQADRAFLWKPGASLDVLLRPDDIIPDQDSPLRAAVVKKAFKGAETLYTLRFMNGIELLSLFPSHLDYSVGDTVGVRIAPAHSVAFEAGTT